MRVSDLRVIAPAGLVWLLVAAGAGGQQFVDETSTRFPSPAASNWSNQVTVGDLDGDGDLDLVFANGGNFATPGALEIQRIFINNGSGVFTDESASRLGLSGLARGVELGDIDDDGDLDLIFAQDFDRQPLLFENDGDGVFTDVTATQMPTLALSSSRGQFGDIDNDGDLDLYLVSGEGSRFGCGQYRVLVNDGTGEFTDETASRHPIEDVCENMDAIFGDIDGDFDLDIRTGSTGSGNSRLYVNNGAGVFSNAAPGAIPADDSAYSYDFGDIDGDGDLDLIGVNAKPSSLGEFLLENDGSGLFTDVSAQLSPNPNDDDNDSKFFDYDNDGDLDLIVARLGGTTEKIYQNDGDGNFAAATGVIEAVADSSLDIDVADLTGDGRLDVVTAQGESGSFVNRIYNGSGGPVDNRAPRTVGILGPGMPTSSDPSVIVRAAILDDSTSDRNFPSAGIALRYRLDGGSDLEVEMRYSGGQIYRGEIPGPIVAHRVEFEILATDWAGNVGTSATQVFYLDAIFWDGFESGDTTLWSP